MLVAALAPVVVAPGYGWARAMVPGHDTAPVRPAGVGVEQATATVVFGTDTIVAEVARTEEERSRGLMRREYLAEDAGMLFVFPEQSVRSFWMQDTYLALDIAFMDASFTVVDIQQMEPMTTRSHTSRAPAMYALEVNQGWMEEHGVRVGSRAQVTFQN